MADRTGSPAYQVLPRSARRVFAAIERTIGDGSSASVSYVDFRLDHHIARRAVSPSLKLLDHLGLIDIEPGPRLVNVFRFSNRWRTVDEVEAERLAALAREVKPHRTFETARAEAGEAAEAHAANVGGRATARHAPGAVTADDAVARRRAVGFPKSGILKTGSGSEPVLRSVLGTDQPVPPATSSTAICSALPALRGRAHPLTHGHQVTRDHLRRIGQGGGRAGDGQAIVFSATKPQ